VRTPALGRARALHQFRQRGGDDRAQGRPAFTGRSKIAKFGAPTTAPTTMPR
jgi:hypothetical protein